jgi:hypothetical protein
MRKEKPATQTPDIKILNVKTKTPLWDAIWELMWPDNSSKPEVARQRLPPLPLQLITTRLYMFQLS